uniref:CSON012695 protein n=1 Tax=Culicoides sonorensis TaxID=179676 RepID=A0A336KMX3_CULSO
MYSEPSFPRGGTIKRVKKESESEDKEIKYGVRTDHLEKKVKPSKKQRQAAKIKINEEQSDELTSKSADSLNKQTVVEGMLLLGVVESINELHIDIALPGKLRGRVPITSISGPYSKLLGKVVAGEKNNDVKSLDKLFKKGQYVSVKVMSVSENPKYMTLSLNPADINAGRYHGQLLKGLVIVGAVSDIEDHGYTIETGIKNVRAFLPIEKTKSKFSVGSLVYGCIDEISSTATTSTIILKTNKGNDIGMLEISDQDPILDLLLPGTVVPFTMTKILKNGLQGTIFETFVSYVNENYLTEPLHRPSDYTIGLQFDSRILYVMPLTKHVALTMNFSKVKFEGDDGILPVGQIVEDAVSLGKSSGSIMLKINKQSKAIITLKSIKSKYKKNYDERTALLAYGKSTKHRLRILYYNAFERVYVCTDNENLLNEPYFSINDLHCGDIVDAKIGKILKNKEKGLAVKVGLIKGYIHNFDCSGGQLKKGMITKSRVLFVDHEDKTVLLTNRSEFLRTNNILMSRDQAKVDEIFTGLIVKDSPALYLVRFFNKVKGVVFKNNTGVSEAAQSNLKVGAIANFRISDIQGERIVLKVATDIDSSDHLGSIASAKIECLYPTGAQIKIKKLNLTGTIPINYFSDILPIAETVFNSMKEGQKIKVVNIMNHIFSLRDVSYYSQKPPLMLKDTQVGDILKGIVRHYENGIIEILCPLKDFRLPIKLHINKILTSPLQNFDEFELKPDTPIYIRVKSKLSNPKTLVVSAKLEDVWDGSTDSAVSLMEQYFKELDLIKESYSSKKKAIAKYFIGECVSGKVTEKFDSHDILVLTLPDGVSALCRNVTSKNYSIGDTVEGKVIWIDYLRQVVDLVINPKAMTGIIEDQSVNEELLKDKQRCKGHVILIRDDVIIVSIGDKGPLVYLPTRFHLNDFQPTLINNLAQYGKCTIHLLKHVQGRMIGMFEENFKQCQQFKKVYDDKYAEVTKQVLERKRKRENSESEILANAEIEDQEPGSLLRVKSILDENEVLKPPKRKKKKHMKPSEDETNPIQETEMSGKNQKNSKPKKKQTVEIENMFINQLDGAIDFEKKKGKKKKKMQNKKDQLKTVHLESKNIIKKKSQSKLKSNIKLDQDTTYETIQKTTENLDKKLKESTEKKFSEDKTITPKIEVTTVKNKKLFAMKIDTVKPPEQKTEKKLLPYAELPGTVGFWSEKPETENESLNEDDSENIKASDIIVEKFTKTSEPKSVRDFDRLLLLKPDDSKLWIKYMQFHMKSFEVEKAKGVGQRAIKVINYRCEKEKLSVWIELLKLEIQHGTSESFNALFREAILRNQPLKVYSKTLNLLIEADKLPQVNGLLGPMLKKYKPHPEMWLIAAETYYRIGAIPKAKELFERAHKSISKDDRKEQEYAQALFENILTLYPARVDVWFQYADMLIKDKLYDFVRLVLDRAIIQKLSARKIKSFYQKYIEFEEKHGTPENVKSLKAKAAEYVKTVTKSEENDA